MKFALALAAVLALPASAAPIPCPDTIRPGMSYHLARAWLILGGYKPIMYPNLNRTAVNSAGPEFGYFEHSDGTSSGIGRFDFDGPKGRFTIRAYDEAWEVKDCDTYHAP